MKKKKLLPFWGDLLESIIIGAVIGAVVGLYQLAMQWAVKGSQYMYSSRNPWVIVAMVFAVALLAVINHFIIKKNKGVAGSGVPHMEHAIHHDHHIDWKRELPLMFFNSIASGFVGMPLGSEGPSVVIGGKTAEMVEDVISAGEEDTVVMAFGTGFGCAVLSPLAGICYIFEEALKKFNVKYFVRGIAMMVTAFLVTSLINHHRVLHIEDVVLLPFKNYYVFVFLVIVNVLLGVAFAKGLVFAKRQVEKRANSFLVKNLGFFIFAVVLVLNFVCLEWMGSGAHIIEHISSYNAVGLILGVIAIRMVITMVAGTDRVTGGIVIPLLTLGALGGQLVCLFCNNYLGMPTDSNPVIVLISMCIIFSVVNKTPITSTVLFFSAIGYSAGNYISVLPIIPMTAVAIFVATYLSKLLVKDGLYHMLVRVDLEFYGDSHHNDQVTEGDSQIETQEPQTLQVEVER